MFRPARAIVGSALLLCVWVSSCAKDPAVAKREFVRAGDAFVAQKQYPDAIIAFRNAVQQDPKFVEAREKLAEAYLRLGDFANACRQYVVLADLQPGDADAQFHAGEALLAVHQFVDARARAEKTLALAPNHVDAQILRANALAGLNKLEDAVAEVEKAIQSAPDRSASYASLGSIQILRGNRDEAQAAFEKAVATDERSVPARLALANFYWAVGRRPDAEAQLKRALEIEPRNLLTNRVLAIFYTGTGRAAEAEPYLKVVADLAAGVEGKLGLADYYLSLGNREKARSILELIALNDPVHFPEAKLRLAGIDAASGNLTAGLSRVEEILAKQPRNAEALIAKAEFLASSGRLDESLAAAQAAIAAEPESASSRFALGKVLALRHEDVGAIAAFNRALQLNPRLATAEVELAKLSLQAGRPDEAQRYAESALAKITGYVEAQLLLARISLIKGDTARAEHSLAALVAALPDSPAVQTQVELAKQDRAKARAAFTRVLSKESSNAEALDGLARLDFQEKQPDAAKARIEAALRGKPADARLLTIAARTYASMGDTAGAERALRQAIDTDPNAIDGYQLLGRLYASERRLPEATAQFQKLVQRRPESVAARTAVGMLLDLQNKPNEARAQYEQTLKLDARAAVAANNLVWIHASQGGNLDVALQLAQTAKAGLPDRHEVNDTLGWIYYKKGLSSLALGPLRQAVDKAPANASYRYHLGMTYASLGEKANARTALEKALATDPNFQGADEARRTLAELKG